jgi:hypothetical protein
MVTRGAWLPSPIPILLRDAQPTAAELLTEEAVRLRDAATQELVRLYLLAEEDGTLSSLDVRARRFCERLKARNGGVLPALKGGPRRDEHFKLTLYLGVRERLEAGASSVDEAIRAVAFEAGRSYQSVRAVWYDRDPEWLRTTDIGWKWRQLEKAKFGDAVKLDLKPRRAPVRPRKPKRRRASKSNGGATHF